MVKNICKIQLHHKAEASILVTIILNVVINIRHPTPLCRSSPTSTSQYPAKEKIGALQEYSSPKFLVNV